MGDDEFAESREGYWQDEVDVVIVRDEWVMCSGQRARMIYIDDERKEMRQFEDGFRNNGQVVV